MYEKQLEITNKEIKYEGSSNIFHPKGRFLDKTITSLSGYLGAVTRGQY